MFPFLNLFFSPLLGLTVFTIGSSLLTTLLTVKLSSMGVNPLVVGFLTTSFFLGYILGAVSLEKFIVRVGYIRAYAVFASLVAVISGLHVLYISPILWVPLRFLYGFCTAGLLIVIESWVLMIAKKESRGQALAAFMLCLYAGQASGQFFFSLCSLESMIPYILISMTASFSVIPLSATHIVQPSFDRSNRLGIKRLFLLSPTGILGCFGGGLVLGSMYGLLPMSLKSLHFENEEVALIFSCIFVGGMCLQYPIGKMSDLLSRRHVLLGVYLGAMLLSLTLVWAIEMHVGILLLCAFALGGVFFSLLPISMNYVCDFIEAEEMVPATAGLLIAYSSGAALGPSIAPFFIKTFGATGLFLFFSSVTLIVSLFALQRYTVRPSKSVNKQNEFSSVVQSSPVGVPVSTIEK